MTKRNVPEGLVDIASHIRKNSFDGFENLELKRGYCKKACQAKTLKNISCNL